MHIDGSAFPNAIDSAGATALVSLQRQSATLDKDRNDSVRRTVSGQADLMSAAFEVLWSFLNNRVL